MKIHEFLRIKNSLMHILTRSDFTTMLSSPDTPSAIKSIVEKPVGLTLYDIIHEGRYGLDTLHRAVNFFNMERTEKLRKLGEKRGSIIAFDRLFDLTNIVFSIFNLWSGRKPTLTIPFGRLLKLELSRVESIDGLREIIPLDLRNIISYVLTIGVRDLSMLFNLYGGLNDHLYMGYKIRKVYGFIRDSMLIRTCIAVKQVPESIPHLLTLSYEDFIEICGVRNIKDLPQVVHDVNPLYRVFSDILNDAFKIEYSLELFDLAVFLNASQLTTDFLLESEEILARLYILYLAETLLVKTVLSAIETGIYVDGLKNLIERWWVL